MPRKLRDLIIERGSHTRAFGERTAAIPLARLANLNEKAASFNC